MRRPSRRSRRSICRPGFSCSRTILYFVVWTAFALWARRAWGDTRPMIRAASAGMIVWALTASLAGVDWIESLDAGFPFVDLWPAVPDVPAARRPGLRHRHGRRHAAALADAQRGYGALLLATLLLWAYIHAMQYIIIWAGNIPDEVDVVSPPLDRQSGRSCCGAWSFLQFVIPFFAMLSARVRSRPTPLLVIAGGDAGVALRRVVPADAALRRCRRGHSLAGNTGRDAATIGVLGSSLQFTLARMERSPPDTRALPAAESA